MVFLNDDFDETDVGILPIPKWLYGPSGSSCFRARVHTNIRERERLTVGNCFLHLDLICNLLTLLSCLEEGGVR